MFFVFSKLLYFLITPIIWIIGLLAFALFTKRVKLKKICFFSALGLLLFFSNTIVFDTFEHLWEVPSKKSTEIIGKYKYAVVLGGMASENRETGEIQYFPSIDRLLKGIELFRKGMVEKILITGGSGLLSDQEVKEAETLKKFCINFGIPDSVIILETESRNTYENALFTKKIIGINDSILLITSTFHMRRSLAIFNKQEFRSIPIQADPLALVNYTPDDYFLPKADPLMKWNLLIKEMVGYVAYRLAGYL